MKNFTKEQIKYIENLVKSLMEDELYAEQFFPECGASVVGEKIVLEKLSEDLNSHKVKDRSSTTKKIIDVEGFSKMCEIIKDI